VPIAKAIAGAEVIAANVDGERLVFVGRPSTDQAVRIDNRAGSRVQDRRAVGRERAR